MIYKADENGMREYSALVGRIARLDLEAERIAQARAQAIEAVKAWEDAHAEKGEAPIMGTCLDEPPAPSEDPDVPTDPPIY